jgi:acyl-CoA synthetase (AMP-forming)/AMP-acid ligase II
MTGSAQYASQRGIVCCICAIPIPLETSKTNERGQAVHEECYVRKIISESRTASAVHLAENWLSSIVVKSNSGSTSQITVDEFAFRSLTGRDRKRLLNGYSLWGLTTPCQ